MKAASSAKASAYGRFGVTHHGGQAEQAEGRNAFCDDQGGALFFSTMSTVVEIIDAVKRLDEKQKNEFLAKLAEIDFDDAWDGQIDADARAGRLDFLWEEAKRDIKEGRTRPLDELLGHE